MWTEDHISEQLLATHLNQDTDLASRSLPAVEKTIDWILRQVPDRKLSILDLGCGPGLYTERLAKKGHRVAGMDFAARSIAYARNTADKAGLDINYFHQDYLTLDQEREYDLILMIFTDFGVLTPDQQKKILENIHRALKPGGVFIFDVLNTAWLDTVPLTRTWEASPSGFWRPWPYLSLSETFLYEVERVVLSQHIIADDTRGTEVYRFYTHGFSQEDIRQMTEAQGFGPVTFRETLLPPSSLYRPEDVTFCVSEKKAG